MSGTDMTTTEGTPDAVNPTPSATPVSAQLATGGTNSADMLTQSEWTRRLVVAVTLGVVGLSTLTIVAVLCYRVAVDGNSSLTSDITTKLLYVAIGCIMSMTVALFGANSLIVKLIEKVVP